MFEDFKAKVRQKQNATQFMRPISEKAEMLNQKNDDSRCTALRQFFSECLDADGCDISLMSGAEWDILLIYTQTRQYLLEKYPQTPQEAKLIGEIWVENPQAAIQIDKAKAKEDPKGALFFDLLFKTKLIYDKLAVLQTQTSEYEKLCLRLYQQATYQWNHGKNCEQIKEVFLGCKKELFEMVEAYFKICKKYRVPTFEEPYYFLTDQQQVEIKLEGDMLRRTSLYSDFEIHISILEALA